MGWFVVVLEWVMLFALLGGAGPLLLSPCNMPPRAAPQVHEIR